MLYLWLKLLHVLTAMVWIGGLVVLAALNFRLSRTRERSAVFALAHQGEFLGTRLLGPASGLTLLSGIAVMLAGLHLVNLLLLASAAGVMVLKPTS